MVVIARFMYECDFALDFGFYDAGYKTRPALRTPKPFVCHCRDGIRKNQRKVSQWMRKKKGTPLLADRIHSRSEVNSNSVGYLSLPHCCPKRTVEDCC